MRKFYLTTVLIAATLVTFSQKNSNVKGFLFDSVSKHALPNATISLLSKKDSSLISFTMSDDYGRFQLTNIRPDDYRLSISHIGYYNTSITFKTEASRDALDLDTIILNDRSRVLPGVTIVSEAPPVTLVGDTILYNAGSFKTQPNAVVEDLLKRLPGIKVDKDGTVKAQGEKVKKVLVDGKEFFGDDPKIATKNISADAVDKVEVFNKLSDQAQLTGFDDGNSEKTINLKLKQDKKKGLFGKATAAGGTIDRYMGRVNINSFKGPRQVAVIGLGNNINAEGFSFMDVLNFTGVLNQLKSGGGNISINLSSDDVPAGLLGGNNQGINTAWAGGINYNDQPGAKTELQTNYFYNYYNPRKQSIIQRQYFSPNNLYHDTANTNNINNSQRLNVALDYQIDSLTSLRVTPSINYQKSQNHILSGYQTLSQDGTDINDGNSQSNQNSQGYTVNTSLLLRKKFHKRKRTFSVNLITTVADHTGDATLRSITDFYNSAGSFLNGDSINQTSNNESSLFGYNARAVYTEPIFQKSLLEFSVGRSNTITTSVKNTYDYNDITRKFDKANDLLTNDFRNTYGYTNAGLRVRKQTKTYNYALGVIWQKSGLGGTIKNNAKDSVISRDFSNILPSGRFQYYFSRFKNIMLDYSTNANAPSITQLQPVPDNTNPLYIQLGNPILKPEFMHSLVLRSSFVSPYRNRNLFVTLNFQETQNKIVNYDKINQLGIDSVTPENVNGVSNLSGNVSWGFPLHFLRGSIELSSDINYSKNKQFASDSSHAAVLNNINTLGAGPGIRLDINPTDKLNFSLSSDLSFSHSQYSLQRTGNSSYLNQQYQLGVSWDLPAHFYFATDFSYLVNGQHAMGFNATVPLWNANFSRQVLKYQRAEIKISVDDILNRNTGITRSTNQNYIEDTRVNALRRYFMLSFTYNISKTKAPSSDKVMRH